MSPPTGSPRNRRALRLVAGLLAGTLLASAAALAQATARFDKGREARGIPLEVIGEGLAFVRAQIAGTPAWLLVDSASVSVLSEKLAQRLSLSPEGEGEGRRVAALTLRLPGVEVSQSRVACRDLDPLEISLGHKVDGILGEPLFASLVVSLDFAGSALSLSDPKSFRSPGRGTRLAVARVSGGIPALRARLELAGRPALEGDFLLDTGVETAAILSSPFVRNHQLLGPAAKTEEALSGPAADKLGAVLRAQSLSIGPFVFHEPVVALSQAGRGLLAEPGHAGIVGGAVLSRFRAVFDLPHGRVFLEKNARFSEPFRHDASGLALAASGADLSTFEIRRVAPGSPGESAGLRAGDILLAVDGKAVKEVGLLETRRLLRQEAKEYLLTIFREGQIRKVTLQCRKLL